MYSCLNELFYIELIICIKMYLVLNNLQRLICHKTQPTNQTLSQTYLFDPLMGTEYVLLFQVRLDLRVTKTKEWFHIPKRSRTGASPPDTV